MVISKKILNCIISSNYKDKIECYYKKGFLKIYIKIIKKNNFLHRILLWFKVSWLKIMSIKFNLTQYKIFIFL